MDSGNSSDSLHNEANDTKDVARDDMFVDCADEIENSDSNRSSQEKNNMPNAPDNEAEADRRIRFQELMSEVELLRNKLERSYSENERLARENEEEKDRESESSNIAQSNFQQYEEITNRILASLFTVHNQEELLDGSLPEKISNVEKSITFLVKKHDLFISESDNLKRCLNEVGLDPNTIDENEVFSTARDKIVELRRKEDDLQQRLSSLEDENRNLIEQLEKQRSDAGNLNGEIRRLTAEVEQEKNRYASTKEKLSMAVTKGKALVQQRDSLKQSLAEKTSQLEKCSVELQEKSVSLEAAEKTKELVLEKDAILQTCSEILSESMETNEFQPVDIVDKLRGVVDENKSLKDISLQYHKLRNALMSFDFPETVQSSELDECVRWLVESFYVSKEEAAKLQSEMEKTIEAAHGEIDLLTTSLLAETQETSYLHAELDDLSNKYEAHERLQWDLAEERETVNNEMKHLRTSLEAESEQKRNLQLELENLRHIYEEVVQKEYHVSQEKDKLVNMLMEASGLANGSGHEEVHPEHSELTSIIDNCFSKIKERTHHIESSQVDAEIIERFTSLLYIRDQEMSLYKLIIEEDILDRNQASCLSDELEMKTQDLIALKDENAAMLKSLGQLEDRCALLKEKLSMAVKKGKGLVQERENLKSSLDEKNSEIDRLKSEIQGNLSKYSECQDQITKLSLDVERISLLETDLFAAKEHTDQLENFLAESKSMLQMVVESIEGISTPTDIVFKEPVEKVKWVARYLSETESMKMEMEQELRKVKDEASSLDEKSKELEVSKTLLEEELEKEKEKASSHMSKLEELSLSKRALEDALSLSEDNISRFVGERDIAIESRDLSEEQLQKLKEEFSNHITKLADADKTIQSLEDKLSQAQKNITLLSEENSNVQISTANFDSEIKKIREDADSHAEKLSEASLTIKSLEDALLNAENNMANLVREKKSAEEEIIALTAKLESHMEELTGTRGSLENRTLELSGHLSRLHLLLEDETLPSLLGQCFDRKFEKLNTMYFLIKEIADCFVEMDLDFSQSNPIVEDDSCLSDTLMSSPDTTFNMEMPNEKMNFVDSESLIFQIEKMNERFHQRRKILTDKFDSLSISMDEAIAALCRRLHSTKNKVAGTIKYVQSLKQQVTDTITDKQRQEETLASLDTESKTLLSACNDAIQGLELNVRKNVPKLDGIISMDLGVFRNGTDKERATDHVKAAEKLLSVTKQNEYLNRLSQDAINKLMSIAEDTQNRMEETQVTCDEAMEERNLYKEKISSLESDLKAQLNMCDEMAVKLAEYEEKEDEWRKKDEELSSSLSKLHEYEDSLLSASQVRSIVDKVNELKIPDDTFQVGDSHGSSSVRKVFYLIDSYNEFPKKVSSLSTENEELQSTIDQQILEIERLKGQDGNHTEKDKDSKTMNTLLELESGLQNIVRNLGGGGMYDDHKVDDGPTSLLPLLDKLVMEKVHESKSLKSKTEELGAKLLGTQKVVDDLSNKIKFLEGSNQARTVPSEMNKERGISVASLSTQSEITEMQDKVALGNKNNVLPVQSAAHARPLRKSSSEHLAISIGSESEHLINSKKSDDDDDDKGHVFKSLNNSGLIPRLGRTVAERFDGIWVSGSRALMSHPRGRLGLVAYWLALHIWLLGTIL